MQSSPLFAVAALTLALAPTTRHPAVAGAPCAVPPAPAVDTAVARRLDYRLLMLAHERYAALAADSAIPALPSPSGRLVRPGDRLSSVSLLRARLAALGDLEVTSSPEPQGRYAGPVVAAIRRFQLRHGLEDDGIIGPQTLEALQFPLALRVRQIERSLELIRAEPPTDGGPFITVNVPAYRLFAFDGTGTDTVPALDMKVIVGRAEHTPTPTLVERLQYLEFQPFWNVPRSILVKEILPRLRRDRAYLHREDMELVGRRDVALGDKVTPDVIGALREGRLRVRQRPGGSNPLGLIKFGIPNDSDIYLHDTPAKELFSSVRRDFSHGCIRVQDARDLATWVMRGRPAWNEDSVKAAMSGGETRRVPLPGTIPVFVEYNTVLATADGRVWFLPDVYGRDGEAPPASGGAPAARPFEH